MVFLNTKQLAQKASLKKKSPVQQHSSLTLQRAKEVIWHHIAAAVPSSWSPRHRCRD